VVLADGSWGTAGNGTITGLADETTYVVVTGDDILGVKGDGTLGTDIAEAAALDGVTAITGLTNGTTYDVYAVVTGTNSGTTSLGEDDYNTVVDITALTNSEVHTIAAGSEKPAAKYVIVHVGQALEAVVEGAVIAAQEFEGATLDYTFGTTTADGAKFLAITAGEEYIILDLSDLTDDSFTTLITVKTAD
jgi:hydrogenase maturation factor